ncbi:hypothetical protein ON010_g18567 [Phytophthora cinnamomi]|nr:hypothetical protein ON010_g18567 [Phytophthora cinnamomi]
MDPHPVFTRRGDDLELTLEISLLEERYLAASFTTSLMRRVALTNPYLLLQALVGFSRELSHLDGHTIKLDREAVVQPTTVWTILNEGMPIRQRPGEFGDLLVHFNIAYPSELDAADKSGKGTYTQLSTHITQGFLALIWHCSLLQSFASSCATERTSTPARQNSGFRSPSIVVKNLLATASTWGTADSLPTAATDGVAFNAFWASSCSLAADTPSTSSDGDLGTTPVVAARPTRLSVLCSRASSAAVVLAAASSSLVAGAEAAFLSSAANESTRAPASEWAA